MASVSTNPPIDLEESPVPTRDGWFEYVNGRTVEKPRMGAQADFIIISLAALIRVHSKGHGLCFSGHCGYQGIFVQEPKRLRYPDISFVRSGRLPDNKPPRGYMTIVPDLIVEVISPRDNAENLDERLMDFLKAGVRLAWLIYPSTRQVSVFRQGTAALRLGEGDVLDGEDVLPGFTCPLTELFAEI